MNTKKRRKKKSTNWKTPVLVISGMALVIVGIIYVSFLSYYHSHFYPNTIINGLNCGNLTADGVKDKLAEQAKGYTLRIHEADGKNSFITASKIQLQLLETDEVDMLLEHQKPALWFVRMFQKPALTVDAKTTYSEEALDAEIAALSCMNQDKIVKAKDAYVDVVDGVYTIIPEQDGNEIYKEKLYEVIREAVKNGLEEVNLSEKDIYVKAKVTSEDESLKELLAAYNSYSGFTITYTFGDAAEVIDAAVIQDWLVVGDDNKVTVSREKINAYVKSLAIQYNTFGKSLVRTLKCADGKERKIAGGDYGWWMNQSETADELEEAVNNKESVSLEAKWRQKADQFGDKDFGDSYCEVDMTKQKVYVILEGKIVMTADCVTGNPNKGNDTPTGSFGIRFMSRNYTLVGEDYQSPVSYWVPFYDDIGFHDATWQSAFGGNRYLTHGSRGCVNLSLEDAEKLYGMVWKGMPVFVYKS